MELPETACLHKKAKFCHPPKVCRSNNNKNNKTGIKRIINYIQKLLCVRPCYAHVTQKITVMPCIVSSVSSGVTSSSGCINERLRKLKDESGTHTLFNQSRCFIEHFHQTKIIYCLAISDV